MRVVGVRMVMTLLSHSYSVPTETQELSLAFLVDYSIECSQLSFEVGTIILPITHT